MSCIFSLGQYLGNLFCLYFFHPTSLFGEPIYDVHLGFISGPIYSHCILYTYIYSMYLFCISMIFHDTSVGICKYKKKIKKKYYYSVASETRSVIVTQLVAVFVKTWGCKYSGYLSSGAIFFSK